MTRLLSLIVALSASASLVAQDETYKIKIRTVPEVGKVHKETETSKGTESTKVSDGDGKVLKDEKKDKTTTKSYTEKVIEGGEKKPKKYQRTYSKAEETVDGKTQKLPYVGRTLVYTMGEKKRYKLEVEGKPELDPEVIDALEKEANKNADDDSGVEPFLPKKAVKVGETWKLDGKEVGKLIAQIGGDKDKAKATGKLVKAYKKDGKQFGVMEFTISTPVSGKGKADLTMTVDTPIDGSGTVGKMSMKIALDIDQTVEQNGMKFAVVVKVRAEESAEREEVAGKK